MCVQIELRKQRFRQNSPGKQMLTWKIYNHQYLTPDNLVYVSHVILVSDNVLHIGNSDKTAVTENKYRGLGGRKQTPSPLCPREIKYMGL